MKSFFCFFIVIFVLFFVVANISWAGENYIIKINIEKRKLTLLHSNRTLKSYLIAVPKSNYYSLPIKGLIKKIVDHPYWIPTQNTREDYKKRGIILPKVVPPGPNNPLGRVAFYIRFIENDPKMPILIHGTNKPESIGKRITRGCIRMHNEDIIKLASIIKDKLPVLVIFEK